MLGAPVTRDGDPDEREVFRPRRLHSFFWAVLTFLFFGSVPLLLVLGVLTADPSLPPAEEPIAWTLVACSLALAVRYLRRRVFLDDNGVEDIGVWRGRRIRWADIERIYDRYGPVLSSGAGESRDYGWELLIESRTGERISVVVEEIMPAAAADRFLERLKRHAREHGIPVDWEHFTEGMFRHQADRRS